MITYAVGHHTEQCNLDSYVRETSIASYEQIRDTLKGKQQEVLAAIRLNPGKTDRELAQILSYKDPNKVRPRRNELYKQSLIKCIGKRKCCITKRTAYIWGVE